MHCGIGPRCLYHRAIWVGFPFGCEKTRKHSAKFSLHVIEGLRVISPFSCLALLFINFHVLVRDIPSGGSCFVGSCFGGIRCTLVRASLVHLCRFLHPRVLSAAHSRQAQFLFFRWVGNCAGWWRRADVLIRSATFATLCFCRRHFALALFRDFCSAER